MSFLLLEQTGGILVATMNRPETRNALAEDAQFDEFVGLADRVDRDRSVRVVVLTGAGPSFCAGGDIKAMRSGEGIAAGPPSDLQDRLRRGLQRVPLALTTLAVPTIAAVNGPAMGAGCDLACMCDIRIAAETASFAENFVRLGLVPGDGGAWLLPRVVGLSKAYEMAFTGDTLTAAEALACGLVSRVVPASSLLDAAMALARRIAANPGHAVRMTKRMIREGQATTLGPSLDLSAAYQAVAVTHPDHREAVAAFIEKRAPAFSDTVPAGHR